MAQPTTFIALRRSTIAHTDEDIAMTTVKRGPFKTNAEAHTALVEMIQEELASRHGEMSPYVEFKVESW